MPSARRLRALVQQLSGGDAAGRAQAAAQLRVHAHDEALLPAILAAGAVPPVIAALDSGDPATVDAAVATLANLNGSPGSEASAAIGAAGGVPPPVRVLQRHGSTVMQRRSAACTLRNLAHDGALHAQAIVDAGGLPALIECLGVSATGLQGDAAGVLYTLAGGSPAIRDAMHVAGAVPPLAALVIGASSGAVQYAALGALQRLACRNPACGHAVAAAGAIPAAVRLLCSPSEEMRQEAVQLLVHLACQGPERASAIVAAGGIPPLLQLLSSPNIGTQGCTVATLHQLLCYVPNCGQLITAAGGTAALQRLTSSGRAPEIRSWAAEALSLLPQSSAAQAAPPAPTTAAAPPVPPVPARPPRICANPGCGATRGLKKCGGCRAVRYCSEACSHAHWQAHKPECRRLQAQRAEARG